MDYKSTVFLPRTDFPMRANLPEREPGLLERWRSIDLFGQYQIRDGRLFASPTVRFSRTADRNNLGTISRSNRGECLGAQAFVPNNGGVLYWQPRMVDVVAPPNVPNCP